MKGQAVEEQGGSVGAKGLLDRCAERGSKARLPLLYHISLSPDEGEVRKRRSLGSPQQEVIEELVRHMDTHTYTRTYAHIETHTYIYTYRHIPIHTHTHI